MYVLLVLFMVISPSLEASIVITIPPNVHVTTIKNPFPFYGKDEKSINEKELEYIIYKGWDTKELFKRHHQPQIKIMDVEPNEKSDQMKKLISVCTDAFANTKKNTVARVVQCVLQGFEKS